MLGIYQGLRNWAGEVLGCESCQSLGAALQ